MKIALVGHGKMGQLIEKILIERGHTVSKIIDVQNAGDISSISTDNTDVAIEFTGPEVAFENIKSLIEQGVPTVSGSTGWLGKRREIEDLCNEKDGAFFYASNFSLGVNIFFKVNQFLARLIDNKGYSVSIEDIHHIHKLDSPSGTAITIAEGIIENQEQLNGWYEGTEATKGDIPIISKREGEVPGTHSVQYTSEIDDITITHEAHSRKGFAMGAVLVVEWLKEKKGILSMDDFLDFGT